MTKRRVSARAFSFGIAVVRALTAVCHQATTTFVGRFLSGKRAVPSPRRRNAQGAPGRRIMLRYSVSASYHGCCSDDHAWGWWCPAAWWMRAGLGEIRAGQEARAGSLTL